MIELIDIHKQFGPVKALNGVSLTLDDGSIHAVLGENGAGKSTLMKILTGFSLMDSGRTLIDGCHVDIASPAVALSHGIGMLYQDPMDFPQFTVLENMMIGTCPGFFLNRSKMRKAFFKLTEELGFSIDPDLKTGSLSIGERQQLEIVRLLHLGVRVLILDEPTTGITDQQKSILFETLRKLAAHGKSIILVSHKMDDVENLCDAVTVLRQGTVTGSLKSPYPSGSLLDMMFDTRVEPPARSNFSTGPTVFRIEDLMVEDDRVPLDRLTLEFSNGEIVALAGLEGSGQDLFLKAACGLVPVSYGDIFLDSCRLSGKSINHFMENGVYYLPGSRLEEGLIPGLSLSQHHSLRLKPYPFFFTDKKAITASQDAIHRFLIKATPFSSVETLSGGNQQRVLLSLLPSAPRVLLLDNPTRGLDVFSSKSIWNHLQSLARSAGTVIIFSTPEIDEAFAHADRIIVFHCGSIVLDRPHNETNIHETGMAIAGKPSEIKIHFT